MIVADIMEKMQDGIVLGIAFTTASGTAFSTFIAIWLHEFPMAMGSIGILIDSGWTFKVAILIAICLNCCLVIGALFGVALGAINKTVKMCSSLYVAGAFIYLGLTLLMPEIKKKATKKVQLASMGGVLLGVGIMLFITQFE